MSKKILLFIMLNCCFISCVDANHPPKDSYKPTVKDITISTSFSVLPVLTRLEQNALLKITLAKGQAEKITLTKVKLSLFESSAMDDIESISLFTANADGSFSTVNQFGVSVKPANEIVFESNISISAAVQSFWVSVKLNEKAELTHKLNLSCVEITTDLGVVDASKTTCAKGLRLGAALRKTTDDGVNTYRIPGLTTTKNGTLIALYDARKTMSRDLQGDIDIAINRSLDGGATWQPLQIVLDMKQWGGLPEKFNGVSDANILVDEVTGDIFVAGLWMYGLLDGTTGKFIEGLNNSSTLWQHQWSSRGSQPGFDVKETSQFMITRSSDNGATWSEPINITRQVKLEEWWLFCPAPGHGITLTNGTLVMPTQGRDADGTPFSNFIYSNDRGTTWKSCNPAYSGVNECMAVELTDGSIMLNMRDGRNKNNTLINGRVISTTTDMGNTWTEHPTSRKTLIEPTCMASLHKHYYTYKGIKKSVLLFSNPNSISNRNNITLKVSFDDGMTWPSEKWILLDQNSGRGYSCITSVDENTIGILYEGSKSDMVFQKINISDFIDH